MSDEDEVNALERSAMLIRNELVVKGLSPTPLTRHVVEPGWCVSVADWAKGRRPSVLFWLDKTLGSSNRDFWIGFTGTRREISSVVAKAIKLDIIPISEYISTQPKSILQKYSEENKFISESYPEYREYYLGKYCLNQSTDSSHFVEWAVDQVMSVINAIEPMDQVATTKIANNSNKTERQQLILARIGQGKFRDDLMMIWKGSCAVTGLSTPAILRASHMVGWSETSDDRERLDANNGLLLSANLDALFDRKLISFDNEGNILLSPNLTIQDRTFLNLENAKLRKIPTPAQLIYLTRHRQEAQKTWHR